MKKDVDTEKGLLENGWVNSGTSYISPNKKKSSLSQQHESFASTLDLEISTLDVDRTSLIRFVSMVKSSTALMTRATGVCHLTAKIRDRSNGGKPFWNLNRGGMGIIWDHGPQRWI